MRKREICKYLGFVIVFLVEQLLVGVNFIDTMFTGALSLPFNSQIKSVAQSTVYFRTVIYAGAVPAVLSYLIYRKGQFPGAEQNMSSSLYRFRRCQDEPNPAQYL